MGRSLLLTRLLSRRVYTVSFPVAPHRTAQTTPAILRRSSGSSSRSRSRSRSRVLDSPAHPPAQRVLAHAILPPLAARSTCVVGARAADFSRSLRRVGVGHLGDARR